MKRIRVTLIVETRAACDENRRATTIADGLPRDEFDAVVWSREDGSLRKLLRAANPDIVHLADESSLRYLGPWLACWHRVPFIATISDLRRETTWIRRRFERFVLGRARNVVAADPTVAERRRIECGLQADADHWRVIEDAWPSPSVAPPRELALAELGLPPTARLIGSCAHWTAASNAIDVLWVAKFLRELHHDVHLVLVGDGPFLAVNKRWCERLGMGEHTRFVTDPVQFDRIAPHWAFYVDAARWAGPSAAIATAQAVGVPVIAVDTPIRRREIAAGRSGYLIAENDRAALTRHGNRLLTDEPLRQAMGAAAREFAATRRPVESMIAAYAELYRQT